MQANINRRNWLKRSGLTLAGITLTPFKNFALPYNDGAINNENKTIRLSSNENPYGPSALAKAAMSNSVNLSNRYQWELIKELGAAVAIKNNLDANNVLLGAGSTQIIDTIIQLAAKQNGNFILANPTFSRWKSAAETLGLQKIEIPLTASKQHNLKAMKDAVNTDTRIVYICNPNNPTGTICDPNALVSFINELSKNTFILVDEAYMDYCGEISLGKLVKDNKNLIVVKTFSKIYGLAGARIGYALAHKDTIEQLSNLQSGSNIGISAMSLAGALASLKDNDFVKEIDALNEAARKYTIAQLTLLGIKCIPSGTNFVYFSLMDYKKDYMAILKANNIEGTGLWEAEGQWTRITIGTMEEMQRFVKVLA